MKTELKYKIDRYGSKYITFDDEYLEKLCRANAGMQHAGNLYLFDLIIKNLKSKKYILEIGTFCGLSANIITYLLRKYNKKNNLITIDKRQSKDNINSIGTSGVSYSDFADYIKSSLKNNLLTFSEENLPYAIEEYSDDFFRLWEKRTVVTDLYQRNLQLGGKISFAYIDGNHSYEKVKQDFINCNNFLEINGYIMFDDSSDLSPWAGVQQLIIEVKKLNNYILIMTNPNYLFQKIA